MESAQHETRRVALDTATVISAVLLVGGFAFVSGEFGIPGATVLSLLLAWPLVVAIRLHRRWPAVHGRELVFLVILLCASAGGGFRVVRAWYASGRDRHHAADVRWGAFERRLRGQPAFRNVQVEKSKRKNIHWAGGVVDSEEDLTRLKQLAAEYGIDQVLVSPQVSQ